MPSILDQNRKYAESVDTEKHAVFATTYDHKRLRVSDPLPWAEAQAEWNRLDGLSRTGSKVAGTARFPHVKFFSVRSMDDPDWKGAPLSLRHRTPVVKGSRGYADDRYFTGRRTLTRTGAEKAARKAWALFAGETAQGSGGWYYWPNGRPLTQGMHNLAKICEQRGMIVQGEGKWYVLDLDLVEKEASVAA